MLNFRVLNNGCDIDLAALLGNLKKSCDLWFLNEKTASEKVINKASSTFDNIITTTVEVLRHGFHLKLEDSMTPSNSSTVSFSSETLYLASDEGFKKMVDDFEWVCRSAQIRDAHALDNSTSLHSTSHTSELPYKFFPVKCDAEHSIDRFLRSWVRRNLEKSCLSACLQALVAEKELLNNYYKKYALLQNEEYSTAVFICLSAIELNQFSLLSQIGTKLYSATTATTAVYVTPHGKHRRTTSHPLFSISPAKSFHVDETHEDDRKVGTECNTESIDKSDLQKSSIKVLRLPLFPTFRKTKSLPTLQLKPNILFDPVYNGKHRPRSKTILEKSKSSATKNGGPKKSIRNGAFIDNNLKPTNDCSTSYSYEKATAGSSYSGSDIGDLSVPSTSPLSLHQKYVSAHTSADTQSSTSTTSIASSSTATAGRRIEIINCDNIEIWTDEAYAESRINGQHGEMQKDVSTTASCNIPHNLKTHKLRGKSSSPISNFLCNLFSTPPQYTYWSIANQSESSYGTNLPDNDPNNSDAAAIFPCNQLHSVDHSISSSGGVFDSFLPIYGKKLRSLNSQSLFEDGVSILDYKNVPTNESSKAVAIKNRGKSIEVSNTLPKYQQSLTDFLQTSQMSRNNTDLEKENAHFLVSEAIISAIEHIKWDNGTDPEKKWRRRKDLRPKDTDSKPTDCLAADDNYRAELQTEPSHDESGEHIPYAELEESCLDLLSAEVVGLSIISKFNDKHLPKVSELKWLVSEEDTPQQLLPMPNNSPTYSPDENVIRPLTRGTHYWAPPRQQIIFTDHPKASRKELILKQNNRCAGCGMRVSRQYIKSFRYCTYLGKYLCTGCHRNQISLIPAKILNSWDFKCYPVSVFSYRLLEQMYTYPLFYVPDLNPALYIENNALLCGREKRVYLKYVKDFIKTCRFAVREQAYFVSIPEHITNDPDIWSLSDFVDVHNKSMQRSIDQLIENCEHHIFNCVLCTARGFHCELCQKDQVIYPWQQNVFRCDRCGSCFHFNCWKSTSKSCSRCQRISKRKEIAIT